MFYFHLLHELAIHAIFFSRTFETVLLLSFEFVFFQMTVLASREVSPPLLQKVVLAGIECAFVQVHWCVSSQAAGLCSGTVCCVKFRNEILSKTSEIFCVVFAERCT